MATGSENRNVITLEAAADLRTLQFCAMQIDTAGKAAVADGVSSADIPIGILLNKPNIGHAAVIQLAGAKCKIKAKAGFAAGIDLTSVATTGTLQTATATDMIIAIALEAATAENDIVSALIVGPYESTTAT